MYVTIVIVLLIITSNLTCSKTIGIIFEFTFSVVDRRKDKVTCWRCERKGRWRGRLKTKDDVVQEDSNHSHPPNTACNLSLKTVYKITAKAKDSEKGTSTFIQNTRLTSILGKYEKFTTFLFLFFFSLL